MDKGKQQRVLSDLVERLREAATDDLQAVVLYGAEAHGDHFEAANDLHLLIVLSSLTPQVLGKVSAPVTRWLKQGNAMPRFFSPDMIRDAADVFPMEFLDISEHHKLLHGDNPFAELQVDTQHLRVQCERELREKLMRLQEAFVQTDGRKKALAALLADSYLVFVDIFRGCLRLHGQQVPAPATEVVANFCKLAELDSAPFESAAQLARGRAGSADITVLFDRYHAQLTKAVDAVDQFGGS